MREIRFRAWDRQHSKMHEVSSMVVGPTVTAWIENPKYPATGFQYQLVNGENADFIQFTGLHDKNGKEIWEGDIVRLPDGSFDSVCWENSQASFNFPMTFNLSEPMVSECHANGVEIIGNIYENPELIR